MRYSASASQPLRFTVRTSSLLRAGKVSQGDAKSSLARHATVASSGYDSCPYSVHPSVLPSWSPASHLVESGNTRSPTLSWTIISRTLRARCRLHVVNLPDAPGIFPVTSSKFTLPDRGIMVVLHSSNPAQAAALTPSRLAPGDAHQTPSPVPSGTNNEKA